MSRYTDNTCPVCHEKFKDDDDIVVCPDCGTPYHRSCWNKAGACLFADKHGPDFEWQPDKKPEPAAEGVVCPNCSAANPAGSKFCNNCGAALPLQQAAPEEQPAESRAQSGAAGAARPLYGQPRGDAQGQTGFEGNGPETIRSGPYIYQRQLGPEDNIDGIKAKEWAAYIGKSSPFYLLNFQRMAETGRRISVSISAVIFGPLYFFYRKMWKWGLVFTLIFLACNVPSLLYLLAVTGSAYTTWVNVTLLEDLMFVCTIVDWASLVLRGLCAVWLYKMAAQKKILALQSEFPNESDRMHVIAAEGGTSMKAVVLAVLLYFILILAVTYMAGPDLYALAASLYG